MTRAKPYPSGKLSDHPPLRTLGEAMRGRTPRDGKPFYCTKCGAGFNEYMACEAPDCALESEESAEVRALLVKSAKRRR